MCMSFRALPGRSGETGAAVRYLRTLQKYLRRARAMSRQPTPVVIHILSAQVAADSSVEPDKTSSAADSFGVISILPPWSPVGVRTPSHHERVLAPMTETTPLAAVAGQAEALRRGREDAEEVAGCTPTRYISERHGSKLRQEKKGRELRKKWQSAILMGREQKASLYVAQTTLEVPEMMSPLDAKRRASSRRSFDMSDDDFDDDHTHYSCSSRAAASVNSSGQTSATRSGISDSGMMKNVGSGLGLSLGSPPPKCEILGWAPVHKQLIKISDLDTVGSSTNTDGSSVKSFLYQQADYKYVRRKGLEGRALQSFHSRSNASSAAAGCSTLQHSSSHVSLSVPDSSVSEFEQRSAHAVAFCFNATSSSILPRNAAAKQSSTQSSRGNEGAASGAINTSDSGDDGDMSQGGRSTYHPPTGHGYASVPPVVPPPYANMEYQVHTRVPGWKLAASQQRRTNLVGLLDIVNGVDGGADADVSDTIDRVMTHASIHGGKLCSHLPLHAPSANERGAVTRRQVQSYLNNVGRLLEARKVNPLARAAALKDISQTVSAKASPSHSIAALIAPTDGRAIRESGARYTALLSFP